MKYNTNCFVNNVYFEIREWIIMQSGIAGGRQEDQRTEISVTCQVLKVSSQIKDPLTLRLLL